MDCKEAFEKLYAYLDRDCASCSMEEIEVHLKICRGCWDRFEFEKKLKERVKTSCCEDLPASLLSRIKQLLEKY